MNWSLNSRTMVARVLAVLVMLGAAGCASSSTNSPSGSAAPSSGPVTGTIVVWDQASGGAQQNGFLAADKEFTKENPGAVIKHYFFPYSVFDTKLRTAVATRTGPDVATAFPGAFGATSFKQGLQPLDGYIAQMPATLRSQVRLLSISAAPNGHTYAVPVGEYAYMLEYNKNLFKKAGLDPAHPPTTYSQLVSDCQRLKSAGIVPISVGWKDGGSLEWYFYVLGEQLVSQSQFNQWQHLQLPMTSPVFASLFRRVVDLQSQGCFTRDAIGMDTFTDPLAQFNSGKSAMVLQYLPPAVSDVKKDFGSPNAVGLTYFPRLPDDVWPYPSTDAGPSLGYAITNWSSHKALAWKYLEYLMGPTAQAILWRVGQFFPNNSAASLGSLNGIDKQFVTILSNPNNHTLFLNFPVQEPQLLYKQAQPLLEGNLQVSSLLSQLDGLRQNALAYWQR